MQIINFNWQKTNYRLLLSLTVSILAFSAHADNFDSSVQGETTINDNAAQSQGKINSLSDQADDLLSEYRAVVLETESLRKYNDQLQRLVQSQEEEKVLIEKQLVELESTNRGIVPLMIEMVDMLERIVQSDIPFLSYEREDRVFKLKAMLDRADITTSEKYRRIMEAYQIELEYGRNMTFYEDKLPGTDQEVNFLKIGRTLLFYQLGDESKKVGWFHPKKRQFEELDEVYKLPIAEGLRIAKNQAAPDLIRLPVIAPEKIQ